MRVSLITFLYVILAAPAWADNLIINGDFTAGNTGFTTSFYYSPGNIYGAHTYDIVTDPSYSHPGAASYGDHTSGDGMMMAINGSASSGDVVWSKNVDVIPNSEYFFSMWTSTWIGPGKLSVRINGTAIDRDFYTPSSTGIWEPFNAS